MIANLDPEKDHDSDTLCRRGFDSHYINSIISLRRSNKVSIFVDVSLNGQFWIGNNIKMMKGLPSQCHRNASRLWEANKDKSRICTGYALSSDGMWRQHSWCIWNKTRSNQIVETTEPRILYYGFVMTTEQCEEFAYSN